MKLAKYFNLYPHCHFVKGFSRSCAVDTLQKKYYFVSNKFAAISIKINHKKVENAKSVLDKDNYEFFIEWCKILKDKNLFCLSDNKLTYNNIDLIYNFPSQITNSIIIYKKSIFKSIVNQLFILNCNNFQLFIENIISFSELESLLLIFDNSICQDIQIVMPFRNEFLEKEKWYVFFEKHKRLQSVIVANSPEENCISMDKLNVNFVLFVTETMAFNSCGEIHPMMFTINLPFFTESQQHNTCLNRKICIDVEGNIKNCPNMQENYGNIADT
ncbi:MAG: hypothetical protein LBV69_09960, partial [Bacteroidales bacterium]|nr:hypothetical protein [Bacteroidales bacterium]